MSPDLTVMRSTLPRRSFVFCAVRRASTKGALNSPPSAGMLMPWPLLTVAIAIVSVGVVPVRPEASPVISGTLSSALLPRKLTVGFRAGDRDVVDVGERFERRLDRRVVERERDRRRRLAVERERERAAGRVGDGDRLALVRELAVERPEAAGVAAAGRRVVAGDQPQVVLRVEVDVAGDVAARAAVVGHPQDLLLAERGRGARACRRSRRRT